MPSSKKKEILVRLVEGAEVAYLCVCGGSVEGVPDVFVLLAGRERQQRL